VMACGGLRSIDASAPFSHVEIQFEDSLLRELMFQFAGDERFFGFSEQGFIGGEIEVFRQLLRDRAAASFKHAGFEIFDRGILDAFPVESLMLKKRRILGDDYGTLQVFRNLRERHPNPFGIPPAVLMLPRLYERRRCRIRASQGRHIGDGHLPIQGYTGYGNPDHDSDHQENADKPTSRI
jgi:hypothetical protein